MSVPRHAVLALLVASSAILIVDGPRLTATQDAGAAVVVTPVTGVSTLHHLGRTIEGSAMGWTGQWSPTPDIAASRLEGAAVPGAIVLSGADLYRISCRACHKPDGSGSPPEINSIIGPIQAASTQWMTARMKQMGREVDRTFIRQLTAGTEADLRKRFKKGGHDMPSFDHLSDDEINVLRPFLDQMAGLPGADARQKHITEPAARVGELVVKGTCHICHDATGPEASPTALSAVIPPLASMPHQKTFSEFVKKIREGTPIPFGTPGVTSRGRMPVFSYLTEVEAAAAYSYLSQYPPK